MIEEVLGYITRPDILVSFLTLSLLEIVLGIDNVIFISIVANRLQGKARAQARVVGLALALVMRVVFLGTIVWITTHLTRPVMTFADIDFSWRDIILFGGGGFLLLKSTLEIHSEVEDRHQAPVSVGSALFGLVVFQIVLLDLVFSIDSILTAVGLSRDLPVMIAAIVVAILVMLLASGPVSDFIHQHPTVKMLALAFLLLIGVALIADAFHFHIPREYLYAAIAFSLFVEILNLAVRRRQQQPPPDGAS